MLDSSSHVVSVEIHGQRYPVRSDLDQTYVQKLAAYVSDKMDAASAATPGGDLIHVALLAALNIADELFRCRDTEHSRDARIVERARALERMVDRALTPSA